MKKIKVGKIQLELAENLGDLSVIRFPIVKEYMIYSEAGLDVPSLKDTFVRFSNEFDKESKAGMFKTVYDFIYGLQKIEQREDPHQMIYTIITFEKGEDRINWDKEKAKEKLSRLAAEGLNQGEVKEAVENFMKGLIGL